MTTIEVLKSSRGNSMIFLSGFFYTQHRITEEKRLFRCENRNCRSVNCEIECQISLILYFLVVVKQIFQCKY